jgi:hypothetical protein
MPPRYSYWTIIAGGLPTAFRAAERDELMPTFTRLRDKHPDAEMKFFARGKLWASPEAAREELEARREPGAGRDRDRTGPRSRSQERGAARSGDSTKRERDWRPGGEHRDPRQKYADAKKARNLDRRRERFARKHGTDERPGAPPRDERPRPNRDWRAAEARGEDQSRGGDRRPTDRPGAQGRTSGAPNRPWNQRHGGGEREPRRAWNQSGDAAPQRPRDGRNERPNAGKRPWKTPVERPAGRRRAREACVGQTTRG